MVLERWGRWMHEESLDRALKPYDRARGGQIRRRKLRALRGHTPRVLGPKGEPSHGGWFNF